MGGGGNCGGGELPDDGGPLLGMDELPLELLGALELPEPDGLPDSLGDPLDGPDDPKLDPEDELEELPQRTVYVGPSSSFTPGG